MTIAFFSDTYFPLLNGVTISVQQYAESLRKQGHTVYIIAPKVRGYKDTDPYVLRLPSFAPLGSIAHVRCPLPIPSRNILKIFRLHFDIVHAHGNGIFSFLGY